MLLKNASRTKYERMMGLAITVLEMPTMAIVSLEPLRAINWNDARPWIAMLGALILFLGWELRKKRREIEKLDLEIAQMRSQQSWVRVATIHEMNSLIKDVEEISARKLGNFRGPGSTRRFRYPFSRVSRFHVCALRQLRNVCHPKLWSINSPRQGSQWFDLGQILSFFVLLDDQIARISRMKVSIFFEIRARSGPRFCSRQIPQKNVTIKPARESLSSRDPRAAARLSMIS